jgi:hypothetical protein
MYQGGLKGPPPDLPAAIRELGPDYTPLVAHSLRAQADAVGVPHDLLRSDMTPDPYADSRVVAGEVFAVDEGVIVVLVERPRALATPGSEQQPEPSQLALYAVGTQEIESRLITVAAVLSEALGCALRPHAYTADRFDDLIAKGMTPASAPSAAEARGAALLSDRVVRRTATGIAASAGGLLANDLARQLDTPDRARADAIRGQLEQSGLVASEFAVICRRSGSQVLRAPSRNALEAAAAAGARCACGRSLAEERIDSAVTLTDLGRELLDGSRWMSVVLVEALHALGIAYDRLTVEHNSDRETVDCFADISGQVCLFMLRDDEFSLGNAYSFGAKLSIHNPPHAVIVTAAKVGDDAKEHFPPSQSAARAERITPQRTSITYIEGLSNLNSSLEGLIESIFLGDAHRALGMVLPLAAVMPASLIRALQSRARSLESVAPAAA